MPLLYPGDTFPELTLTVPGGQSTGFVINPQGKVVVSVYSSGPSAGSCPTTWPGSSVTSASTPRHRPEPHPEALTGGSRLRPF
jgi:hypothetical protein